MATKNSMIREFATRLRANLRYKQWNILSSLRRNGRIALVFAANAEIDYSVHGKLNRASFRKER